MVVPNKNHSTDAWECNFDYVIQFNYTIGHIPGKNNTAADYLLRLKVFPKKLILRIREDIPTAPTDLHVQSVGVSE